MTCSLPGFPSLPLALEKAVCAAQQVHLFFSVLLVDCFAFFSLQPRASTGVPLSAHVHIPLAPRPDMEQAPCCPHGPAACSAQSGGTLLSSVLTSPSLILAELATCPGSRGKDPELTCSTLGQAGRGTRVRGQVPGARCQLPVFQDPPGQNLSPPSAHLQLLGSPPERPQLQEEDTLAATDG